MTSIADLLPLAPELLLLLGACAALIVGASGERGRGPVLPVLALVTIAAALVMSLRQDGSITQSPLPGLVLTSITAYVRWVTLGVGLLIVLVNFGQGEAHERGEYVAMLLFSLLGVLLTAAANDVVTLFFAVELVSIPSYVMIALSRQDVRASEATVKYFFLGALAAAVLAYGLSFMYGVAGTTTIHAVTAQGLVSQWPQGDALGGLGLLGLLLVIGGLAFKIAAVPFHVYAPDVYEGAASPVTGMLGFVPKMAGFVALIKVLTAVQWVLPGPIYWVLWLMAVASMTFGNVMALLQINVKRMLAYSSIAHTGYMLIALLIGPVAAAGPMGNGVAALLFYMAVYGVMNLGAFALLSAFRKEGRGEVESLDDLSGLARREPWPALALAVCVFSLMGFPPTAGFVGKFYIFGSALSLDAAHPFHGPVVALAIIGVLNSALAAAYYLRIVAAIYVKAEIRPADRYQSRPVLSALAVCATLMVGLFLWPGGLADESRGATSAVGKAITSGGTRTARTDDAAPLPAPTAEAPDRAGGTRG